MNKTAKAIWDVVNARRDELAAAVVKRQWSERPDLERRYGLSGYARCLEDARHHLQYLAEAVASSEPALFADYATWAQVMLESRHIPVEDLRANLRILREVLADSLPGDLSKTVRECVDRALHRLGPPTPQVPSFLETANPLAELGRSYLASLLRFERSAAAKTILDAVDAGVTIKDLYRYLFEPCQREVGRLWQINVATVAQEHYCTASTQLIMALLYPRIFADHTTKLHKMVAACVPGELHELGPRMVCDLLEMEGWDTVYLGANVPLPSLLSVIKTLEPEVVAISATMAFHLDAVRQIISALRDSPQRLKIFVGGHAFRGSPSLWESVGADGCATDLTESIELFEQVRV